LGIKGLVVVVVVVEDEWLKLVKKSKATNIWGWREYHVHNIANADSTST
jgi:hypothetical protein